MKVSALRRAGGEERLIGALVPAPIRRLGVRPMVLPVLPVAPVLAGAGEDDWLLDVARLDGSGRFSARPLLAALGWCAGHRVGIDPVDCAVVVASLATGRYVVGGRGELAVPVAARRMCGIAPGVPVVLAASIGRSMLVVHPAGTVVRLLRDHHTRLVGVGDGR